MGGKSLPWYMLGLSDASAYVRYIRHYVDGQSLFCLWHEEHLDPLAVAGVQPGVHDDVSFPLAAKIELPRRGRNGWPVVLAVRRPGSGLPTISW